MVEPYFGPPKNGPEPYEGMWDFDGSCAPGEDGSGPQWAWMETFSLGCFQWVRRGKDGTGAGLKKGRVQYRVKGRVDAPKAAYEAARAYCARRNARTLKQLAGE